ncbi:MAG: hypothetical protein M1826_003810 [Phylliscum demangeonii]|nr:MAG: hypothetical protein M1826_003810 [Phylliscum demangeonii]
MHWLLDFFRKIIRSSSLNPAFRFDRNTIRSVMKLLCLIATGTFIVRSNGLHIPRGPSEYMSSELARPNTPLMFAVAARTSWPLHAVKPRLQKHAVLTKRTTDEASANRQKDVDRDVASVQQDPKIKQAAKRRRKSIDDLLKDPKLHEIAQSSGYPVEELAVAKRRLLDAINAADEFKKVLTEAEKVRKVTPEEKGHLQALAKVYHQQITAWRRMSQGKPVDQRVRRPQKSIDDLLEDPKLHEIAQSSGYPVEELAKARRRFLDAHNAVVAFKKKLAEVEKVRKVTPEEKGQLEALAEVRYQQMTVWRRMNPGNPVDQRLPRQKTKSIDDLTQDPKLHEMAQSSGYPVEELAKAKRRWLDGLKAVREFKKELTEVKKVRKVTLEERVKMQELVRASSQQLTVFRRMSQRLPVDNVDVAALRQDAKADEVAHLNPVSYTPEQIASFDQTHLDALYDLLNFQQKLSALKRSGGSISPAHEVHLEMLQDVYNLRRAWWEEVRQGLSFHGLNHEGRSVKYTAQEVAGYNQLFLDASDKLRAFEKQVAVAQQAGHSPTPDVKAQHRALQEDFNKKAMWFRARDGTPVDRVVHKRPESQTAPSPETRRSGDQEQASQASPAEGDPSAAHPPLQVSGPRHLLVPFVSSASHLLQGVGRQWRVMPWTRYLAAPRLNEVTPAEWLRTEHALP